MKRVIAVLASVALLGFLGVNLFVAYQLSNALFLAPAIAVISTVAARYHRPTWFLTFLLLLFFDLRGELHGIPVHLWEVHLLAAGLLLLVRADQPGLNRIEVALLVLFSIAVVSALLNSSFGPGLKSAVRWLEYLVLYRVARLAAASLSPATSPSAFARILAFPLIALALFSIVQATVLKEKWVHVLQGRAGALILGPTEAKNRVLKNNFSYNGEHGDAFRAPGLYLSAVDLSAVLMISVTALYLTGGQRNVFTILATLLGGAALVLTMGRAALLYGGASLTLAILVYQRRPQTLFSLLIGVMALGVALAVYTPARERLLKLTETEQNSEEERILIWKTGLNIWKSSPIYGKGGGSMSLLFDDNAEVNWLEGKQGSTHSTYIGTLAELGLLGLAAWFYFLWTLRRDLANRRHSRAARTLLCFCLIFFVAMGVSSDTYTAGNPYFVLLLVLFGWYSRELLAEDAETWTDADLTVARAA